MATRQAILISSSPTDQPALRPTASAALHHEARGRKLLVADADRTVLEMLQIRLDVAGYHVCIARTGMEVLELLRNLRPAAMVLDRALPDIDALEILGLLRSSKDMPTPPTLLMGRNLAPDDVKRAASLGARDCLVKPFSGAQALERLARMIRLASPTPPMPFRYV